MLIINYIKKKKPDSMFIKAWENKRLHALICLILWAIFIAFIFLILGSFEKNVKTPSNDNNINEEEKIITFDEMKEKLLHNKFEYKYTLYLSGKNILYYGVKNGLNDSGYKEENDKIIRYVIENEKEYQLIMNTKVEVNNLYEDIDKNFIDLNYVFALLENMNKEIDEVTESLYYSNDELNIKIKINSENIESIDILKGNDSYFLEFSNVL